MYMQKGEKKVGEADGGEGLTLGRGDGESFFRTQLS